MPTTDGPLYLASAVTNRVKGQYEDWLEGRARRRAFDMRTQMDDKEFKETMRAVQEACAAGTFAWGGAAFESSLEQVPGIVKMVALLANDKEVKRQHPEQAVDESRVLELIGDKSMRRADPNDAEKHKHLLVSALEEIIKSTPNFLTPPNRGAD